MVWFKKASIKSNYLQKRDFIYQRPNFGKALKTSFILNVITSPPLYLKYENIFIQIVIGYVYFCARLARYGSVHWREGCGQYIDQWSAVSRYTLALNPLSHAIIDPYYRGTAVV